MAIKKLADVLTATEREKLMEAGARTLSFHLQNLWLRSPLTLLIK